MSEIIEQRSCIKFCMRNEISASETHKMLLKAFGDQCIAKSNVFKWYREFKEGTERIEDGQRSGRPSMATDENPDLFEVIKTDDASTKMLKGKIPRGPRNASRLCDKCRKVFPNASVLGKHKNIHLNEALICQTCGKRFNYQSNLRVHENVHNGKKPYKCSVLGCEHRCAHKSNLNKHMIGKHKMKKPQTESFYK